MRRIVYTAVVLGAALIGFVAGGKAARDDRETLMQIDREFDEEAARRGSQAWADYFAEDGIIMPQGKPIVAGRKAIREAMSAVYADPKFVMRWEPLGAEVAGKLGYTYGLYRSARPGPNGQMLSDYGKYLSVWRKERDGWKIAVDCGNPSPPPEKKPAAAPQQ